MPRFSCDFLSDAETEQALLLAWQQKRDSRALSRLLSSLEPRLLRIARQISRIHTEDLMAEGQIALIEAAGRWRAEGATPFYAYGAIVARAAMLRAHSRLRSPVSEPERQLRDALAGRRGEQEAQRALTMLETEELDEDLPDPASPAAEELHLSRERRRNMRQALAGALRPLGRAERHLILRHLLRGEEDFDCLASGLGMAPARARQIEGRALHKMRNALLHAGFGPGDLN